MVCKHLHKLEDELQRSGIKEVYRGQTWTLNCREWVYFDCVFADLEKTIDRLHLDRSIISIHSHLGTHDGQEHGLVCKQCNDAVMGQHPEMVKRNSLTIRHFE